MEIPDKTHLNSVSSASSDELPSVSLLRRFAAIFYDSLLLFAVLFFAGALVAIVMNLLAYPFGKVQSNPIYTFYLVSVSFFYFAWQWRRGGQTLGMLTWRIRVETRDGKTISWKQALLRFTMALISWLAVGIGFFWALVDKRQLTWHDKVSDTRLVYVKKNR